MGRSSNRINSGDTAALATLVHTSTESVYDLCQVTGSGTYANQYAVMNATHGDMHSCMVAVGSYIGGDNSWFSCLTTSDFLAGGGPTMIKSPAEVVTPNKSQIVPLPYYIPGSFYDEVLQRYENKILLHLHVLCLIQKVKGRPFKALLLELILCGNGATLSDGALGRLGLLAKQHGFHIIVDEVMTGGRLGASEKAKMLYLQSKPKEFQDAVAFVTMGKWLGCGVVLVRRTLKYCLLPTQDQPRGMTTDFLPCNSAIDRWETVASTKLEVFHERRAEVLKALKLTETEAWGEGLLIFAPLRRTDAKQGLKNRFVPMLSKTPIDTSSIPRRHNNDWSKWKINSSIVDGVSEWVSYHDPGDLDVYTVLKGFVRAGPGMKGTKSYFTVEEVRQAFLPKRSNNDVRKVLEAAQAAGILQEQKKTRKRIHVWFISQKALPPTHTAL